MKMSSVLYCVFACVSSTEAYFQKLDRWKPSLQKPSVSSCFYCCEPFAGWQRFKQRMSGMFIILAYDTVCFVRHPGGVVWVQSSIETKRSDTFAPSMQILPFCSSVDGSSVLLCKFINGFCESLACFWGRRALIVPTHLNWEVLVHREGDSRLLLRNRHYFNNVCGVGDVVSWP